MRFPSRLLASTFGRWRGKVELAWFSDGPCKLWLRMFLLLFSPKRKSRGRKEPPRLGGLICNLCSFLPYRREWKGTTGCDSSPYPWLAAVGLASTPFPVQGRGRRIATGFLAKMLGEAPPTPVLFSVIKQHGGVTTLPMPLPPGRCLPACGWLSMEVGSRIRPIQVPRP